MQSRISLLKNRWVGMLLLSALMFALISGCSPQASKASGTMMEMAPLANMPADVQSAPVSVQQAYQFAAAHPDIMTQIPCYCGCGAMGHTSNYDCYISGKNSDGSLLFDSHALGCSICVDITQDTMRLMQQGKSVPEIRGYIDSAYAQYGPSNIP
jgi:hypothetical protein